MHRKLFDQFTMYRRLVKTNLRRIVNWSGFLTKKQGPSMPEKGVTRPSRPGKSPGTTQGVNALVLGLVSEGSSEGLTSHP
jgi:hypothetical protein